VFDDLFSFGVSPPKPPPRSLTSFDSGWTAIPDTSQELALAVKANHILYTGARGPGKTDTQLMRFYSRVGMGYGSYWRGVIFDKEYKMLDDLILKSKRWFYLFQDGGKFLESTSALKWVWPGGEELLFRAFSDKEDYWNYHGQEFPFIGWNELCKYPVADCYNRAMSLNRSSFTPEKDTPIKPIHTRDGGIVCDRSRGILCSPIPLETFSTTNSYGPGHAWVKRRFIDPAPYGKIVNITREIFNPQTQREESVTKSQVAIFGSYRENIYLSPEYIAELEGEEDENLRASWLEGSWDITAGGALSDVWRSNTHVIPQFNIPKGWYVDRSGDWGSSHPFWIGWWAEANGEEVDLGDGRIICLNRGSLILIEEWYGTKEVGTNKGLKLSAGDVADGIRDREIALMATGRIAIQPFPGPMDNQIREVREVSQDTIEKTFADHGIIWQNSDKSRGSRIIGLQLARGRLQAAQRGEGPGLYVMENCRSSIAIIPNLPRDEKNLDDIDTTTEDHPWDGWRYRILKGNNRLATEIEVNMPY
jgi:hypothetical protein